MPTVLSFTDQQLRDLSFALDLAVDDGERRLRERNGSDDDRDALERLRTLSIRFNHLIPVPDSPIQP